MQSLLALVDGLPPHKHSLKRQPKDDALTQPGRLSLPYHDPNQQNREAESSGRTFVKMVSAGCCCRWCLFVWDGRSFVGWMDEVASVDECCVHSSTLCFAPGPSLSLATSSID